MSNRLFPDQGDGVTRSFIDNKDGTYTIKSSQDVEPILDGLQRERGHWDGRNGARDFYKVGSIPMALIEKWIVEEGVNPFDPANRAWLNRKLNDIDFFKLRVWRGKLPVKGV